MIFHKLIILIILFSNLSFADPQIPEKTVLMEAMPFENKGQKYLTLYYQNAPGWHTYWKNPGDAGLPIQYEFYINDQEAKLDVLEWPVPKKYNEQGGIQAFGYSNSYALFFKIPQNLNNAKIKIVSKWLVCKHICIPGQIETTIDYPNFPKSNSPWFEPLKSLDELFNQLPQKKLIPENLELFLSAASKDNQLYLTYTLKSSDLSFLDEHHNLITPFPEKAFDFNHEKLKKDNEGNLYGIIPIEWDGEYQEPELPFPIDGVFAPPRKLQFLFRNPATGETSVIEKEFDRFTLNQGKIIDDLYENLLPISLELTKDAPTEKPSLLLYILYAFIGGLILNFMPCVLPVISIKLFGLIKHKKATRQTLLKHNLSFTMGVVSTFWVLAVVIISLKQAGESVGWGFQLQSPYFIGATIISLFIFTLNLFGLFEFSTPGGRKLGNVKTDDSFFGDFLSGILATILSTPCSAPFLGTALTFAFTASTPIIFTTLTFVGLGLSFPFIMTAIFPKSIQFLPAPGLWMEHFKKFLGLTLILTTIWLLDIFQALVDNQQILTQLFIVLSFIFFAFYFSKNIGKKKISKIIYFIIPSILTIQLFTFLTQNDPSVSTEKNLPAGELPWQQWSVDKMQEHQKNKVLTFIDFTAKWCFTCKVNEQLVLNTDAFKKLIEEKGVKLLLADWTKRDKVIGDWLATQGYVGVPAYFVINKNGDLIKLGETITIDKITKSLE